MRLGLAVAVALANLAVEAGAQEGPSRGPSSTPAVFDAAGRLVGGVAGVENLDVLVGLAAAGRVVTVRVGSTGFLGGTSVVRYEQDDCVGSPLLTASSEAGVAPLEPAVGIGPDRLLLVETGAPPSTLTVRSFWDPAAAPDGCVSVPGDEVLNVVPTEVLADLRVFQPPFALR